MKEFYRNKRVFITGDTGFKGSFLSMILAGMGAEVYGYALEPEDREHSIFYGLGIDSYIHHETGDIRDYDKLARKLRESKAEIVFHLAAQPLVRESYREPRYTYETNVLGTVNILESIRMCAFVRSVLNITTDKVYENNEEKIAFSEDMRLNGHDPYSNSKSCSELVTDSYKKSFFSDNEIAVSTARAGNVIGGGDFAKDRIIPDCARALAVKSPIEVRNPYSIRPYQHVFEPLYAYLLIAMKQYENKGLCGSYNVGPDDDSCITTGELAELFCSKWGEGASWIDKYDGGPYEAGFLKLNCDKIKETFGWMPRWSVETAIEKTVLWYKSFYAGDNMKIITDHQISEYFDI